MTYGFLVGFLAGMSTAWVWYVIASWLDTRVEQVELDDAWVRFTDSDTTTGGSVYYRRIP